MILYYKMWICDNFHVFSYVSVFFFSQDFSMFSLFSCGFVFFRFLVFSWGFYSKGRPDPAGSTSNLQREVDFSGQLQASKTSISELRWSWVMFLGIVIP